jgi:hypothetical protein
MDSTLVVPEPPNSVGSPEEEAPFVLVARGSVEWELEGGAKPNKQGARLPLWRRRTGACGRASHACGRAWESSSRRRRPESSRNRTNRRGGEWRGRAFFFDLERKSFGSLNLFKVGRTYSGPLTWTFLVLTVIYINSRNGKHFNSSSWWSGTLYTVGVSFCDFLMLYRVLRNATKFVMNAQARFTGHMLPKDFFRCSNMAGCVFYLNDDPLIFILLQWIGDFLRTNVVQLTPGTVHIYILNKHVSLSTNTLVS